MTYNSIPVQEASKVAAFPPAEISQLTPVDPTLNSYFSLPCSFGRPRPVLVYEFWCRLLTAIRNWNQEPAVLFVLEQLILFGYKKDSVAVTPHYHHAPPPPPTVSSAEYLIVTNKVIQERFKVNDALRGTIYDKKKNSQLSTLFM